MYQGRQKNAGVTALKRASGPVLLLVWVFMGSCKTVPTAQPRYPRSGPLRHDVVPRPAAVVGAGDEPRFVPSEAYFHYLKGRLAAEGGDCRRAVASYSQATSYDPDSAYLHAASADCLLRLGMIEQSMIESRRALYVDPQDLEASLLLARALMMVHDLDAASQVLEALRDKRQLELRAVELLAELRFAQNRQKEAVALVEQLASRTQTDPRPTLYLAHLLLARGEAEQAAAYFERSLRIDPDQREAWVGWIQALENKGDLEQAVHRAREWGVQRPRDDKALLEHARLATRAGQRRAVKKLVSRSQTQGLADGRLCELAGAIAEGGDQGLALQVVREILSRRPEMDQALHMAGQIYGQRGQLSQAARNLSRIKPRSSLYAISQAELAAIQLRQARAAVAAATLRTALTQVHNTDDVVVLRVALSEILARNQRYAQSLAALDPVIREVGRSRSLLAARVHTLHDNEQDAQAVKLVLDRLEHAPDDSGLLILLAIAHYRGGAFAEAEGAARQALGLDADNMLAQNFLAYTLAERGRALDEALALARRAVASAPEDGYVRDTLGFVHFKRGELDDARRELQQADRLSPDEPEILLHLGQVEKAKGQAAQASKRFRRALRLYPRDRDVREALGAEIQAGPDS